MLKKIVIIGATSAMAEHCARLWVHGGPVRLVLVGRDAGRLARVAADLAVRSPASQISVVESGFSDTQAIAATVAAIAAEGRIDIALIAHGSLPDQSDCEANLASCRDALEVNAISPVLFAEALAGQMAQAGGGNLALIGSVAGDRGRKSNYVYGAAKGLVTRYAQGLQHRYAGTAVKVTLIKPGPTATPMTAHLSANGARLAAVEDVAAGIVKAIAAGQATAYLPGKWRVIMLVIQHLPSIIFNKINI